MSSTKKTVPQEQANLNAKSGPEVLAELEALKAEALKDKPLAAVVMHPAQPGASSYLRVDH